MCFHRRKTIDRLVCPASSLLAGVYCPTSVTRRYYVNPRPGEPTAPTDVCVIHTTPVPPDPPPPPEPTITLDVCASSLILPNAYCPKPYLKKTFPESQAPTTKCKVHTAPPPPPPDPDVRIEVCKDSLLAPSEWCVSRKTITVKQSTLPLAPCPTHTAPRLPVYIGALDLLGATGDWMAFLSRAKSAGAAGVRIVTCYSWNSAQPISPYAQVGTWTHETTGETFPLYRLSAWNAGFWLHLTDVLKEMKRLKLTAWLVAEDYCSLKGDKHEKYFNPFYCSEEALGPSTHGGVWGEPMKHYHKALYAKIVNTANASGVSWLFEAMNETAIVDGTDAEIVAWNEWAHEALAGLGVPKSRMVATPGQAQAFAIAAQVGTYSPHGIGRPADVQAVAGVNVTKTLFSSDGFKQGAGPADAKGKRGVGLDVADALARKIINIGAVGYELFDRGIWHDNDNRANLDDFNPAVLIRMTRGV